MRLALVVAAVALVLACFRGGYPPDEGRLGVQDRDDPRLVIRGEDPFWAGGLTVQLDSASYVATFYVFSNGIVRAFYPYRVDQQQRYQPGQHTLRASADTAFADDSPGFGAPVLLVVASDDSLRLTELRRKAEGFEGARVTNYRFGRTLRTTMEGVVRDLVADYDAATWTAYFYSP
jgi:hypothetical protein